MAERDGEPLAIGSRLELMVDDHMLERLSGDAALQLHRPVAREVVFPNGSDPVAFEEGKGLRAGHAYMTVFQDGGVYRMYYGVSRFFFDKEKRTRVYYYAESKDGIRWETPNLGLFEFEGSRDNNIVWWKDDADRLAAMSFSPFRDKNPACEPQHRYKALALLSPREEPGNRGLSILSSPDGFHWSVLSSKPVITDGAFDSQNLAFWDAVRGEYRAYWRDFYTGPEGRRYRAIKTATSADFMNWSPSQWLYYPGAEPEELYTNQVIPYYRAPHLFVGFPSRYVARPWSEAIEDLPEQERRRSIVQRTGNERFGSALTDTVFMSSRDGVRFTRWGEAFIRPGLRGRDNWIYGDNYANWGIVTTASDVEGAPDELSFYVSEGSRRDHYSKVYRRYTLRVDGFVSVQASRRGGEVITRPLTFAGKELVVNFSGSAAGGIRVELQDMQGVPIPGFSLADCVQVIGDNLERRVRWADGANPGQMAGSPVRLRFQLIDADLFSFRFR
jgi:hypothetical protein